MDDVDDKLNAKVQGERFRVTYNDEDPYHGADDAARHDRRVLGLPVPVLLEVHRHAARGRQGPGLRQGRAHRLQAVPAADAQGRGHGLRGRAGRRQAGQVLGDARHPLQEPEGDDARRRREVRRAAQARHGRVQGGARQAGHLQGQGRRRHGDGQAVRGARHAELLHQRQVAARRAAGDRGAQEAHRRGEGAGRAADQGRQRARGDLRAHHEGRQGQARRAAAGEQAAPGPARPGRQLRGAGRRPPLLRPRGRAGHDRRVQRLPVPVLQPRQPDDEADQGDLPEGRARRVPSAAARLPRPRPPGRQGRAGRRAAGQVLGDARRAVRQPEGARRQVARDLRVADPRPQPRPVEEGPRRPEARDHGQGGRDHRRASSAPTAPRRSSSTAASSRAPSPSRSSTS
jgi:hypothetical protein